MSTAQTPKRVVVVLAATPAGGIGNNGGLPWPHLSSDLKYFRALTCTGSEPGRQNAVIMGRRTWQSLPKKPLPRRINIVVSTSTSLEFPGATQVSSLQAALDHCADPTNEVGGTFVVGGARLFEAVLQRPECSTVHYTKILRHFQCDTFVAPLPPAYVPRPSGEVREENDVRFRRVVYDRIARPSIPRPLLQSSPRHEEYQYLQLIQNVLQHGSARTDRTGTGTLALFGATMRFSLRDDVFPLLTTKRVFWKGIVEELLWFISGSTNANVLSARGVRIWDANGTSEFLAARGLHHREEGDLGPVYGFQWRHFGAEYTDMHEDYSGQGVDQLAQVIEQLKTDPSNRRIVLTAWNPADLHLMALPPCHMFCQFFVANGELSCQLYQRSCDMGLGVPFNIASYALLTRMVAQVTGLRPGEFVHVLGDYHVYQNHIAPLQTQLSREPRPFPTLKLDATVSDIDDFTADHFLLENYNPHACILMQLSV